MEDPELDVPLDRLISSLTDYTNLLPADIAAALEAIASDTEAVFGPLDARRLNWRPDARQWSIAQCFDHLLNANRLMFQAADAALTGAAPRTIWQRLPLVPGMLGRALIRSQSPAGRRKYTAPLQARPAASDLAPDVVRRFMEQQRQAATTASALDGARAARIIMTSPFVRVVTYSVLDGWRIVVAHNHRHIEQARRVLRWQSSLCCSASALRPRTLPSPEA
jgi:DinB superfamily